MTLFDLTVGDMMNESILGRAQERDIIRIEAHQIRDYTLNKQKQVDDYPYGGGHGAVMQADPLYQCWKHIVDTFGPGHTIYMSPAGKTFVEADARRLRDDYDHLILVCGHYEGIDERFIEECVDEEISIGDFVLTGGELAAMVVADAVARLVPGVLSDPECFEEESHWNGLLEYPQYSRPEEWHGRKVPPIPPLRRSQEHRPLAAQAVHPPHPPAPPGSLRQTGSFPPRRIKSCCGSWTRKPPNSNAIICLQVSPLLFRPPVLQ